MTKNDIKAKIQASLPSEATLHRGWGLQGAGAARFGVWARYPTGKLTWLGPYYGAALWTLMVNSGKEVQ